MATMLRQKLLRPISSSSIRAFTTSTSCQNRSATIGDINSSGAADFDAKQKQFREDLATAKRKKEQAESQSTVSHPVSIPSSVPVSADSTAQVVDNTTVHDPSAPISQTPLGLGSLSIAGEQRQAEQDTSTKRSGKLSNLIYGTPEGRQLDQEMERSFSQLLARGKYVHSIVFHDVKPDKVDEYVKTVGEWYPKVASNPENKVNLVGSWRTEIGDSDTFGKLVIFCKTATDFDSSHLGVSTISWLSRFALQHLTCTGISGV